MQARNLIRAISRRPYSFSAARFAETVTASAPSSLVLNFCTPHQPILAKKG